MLGIGSVCRHDLIICQGVIQYLPDPDVAAGRRRRRSHVEGLAYVDPTTGQDLRERADTGDKGRERGATAEVTCKLAYILVGEYACVATTSGRRRVACVRTADGTCNLRLK